MEPLIRQIERLERHRRQLPALIGLAVFVVVGATWVGFFGFLSANTAYGAVDSLQDEYLCDTSQLDLSFPDLSRLSTVYTQDGVKIGQLTERNSQPISLSEMPDLVKAALLSAEDKSFYEHRGIDFSAIGRAVVGRLANSPSGGGSTITQQVVKQNFLSSDQTIERKLCEAVVAAELETLYTKDQILEFWANSVYFGSNAYGISAASEEYFGKPLDELTLHEAALLPVPIRNPTFYHPRTGADNALAARNRTIERMVINGYITRDEAAEAKAKPLDVIPNKTAEVSTPQAIMSRVNRTLLDTNEFGLGETYEERKRAVFGCPASVTDCEGGGGLRIDITVNDRLQREANRILRAWFRPGLEGPTGAISTIDNASGAIRVMASGLDFGDDLEAGQRPYDLASGGARHAGSVFKPITLAAALDTGIRDGSPITLGSYWNDASPAMIPCDPSANCENNVWTVHNAGGNSGNALRTLDSATYNSINAVYARLVEQIGPESVVTMATKLGIRTPLAPHLSITLGAQDVRPEDVAVVYSTLANYGEYHDPYLIQRITDTDGTVLYEHQSEPREVLDKQVAAAVVGSLKKVVTSGTGRRADIGRPQAGKTGTSTDNADVWFAGFIPQLTTVVWIGDADGRVPLKDFTVWNDLEQKEQFYRSASGGTLAAPVWRQFMEFATQGIATQDFAAEPPGTEIYRQTPFAKVPTPGLSTKSTVEALYGVGLAARIVEVPSVLPQGTFITTDPVEGTTIKQGSEVLVEVSSGVAEVFGLPDLRGLSPGEVTSALSQFATDTGISLGWTLVEVETANAGLYGLVVSTNPAPGSPVAHGDIIEVRIGRAP
ncbi:MAG: transglycosylase domain-containing protein [Acidimicrobiia bacterium]|nr:transglycosylase domain-containing protein [Acidimicrobiia bacterium]